MPGFGPTQSGHWPQKEFLSTENQPETCEAIYHIKRPEKSWAALVSKQQLQARPYNIYGQHYFKGQHGWEILRKCLQDDKYGSMNAQLDWLTEILLILRDSNMVWREAFVSQLGEKQERQKPIWWPPPSCISGH